MSKGGKPLERLKITIGRRKPNKNNEKSPNIGLNKEGTATVRSG